MSCPLGKENCEGCPYQKEGLCDWPYVGAEKRPKIVCLCGSTKFKDAFTNAQLKETLNGHIVLTIGCNMKSDTEIFGHLSSKEFHATKKKLDKLHFRKIEMADWILVLNVGGYIGESTSNEIAHANKLGKPVKYLEPIDTTSGKDISTRSLKGGKGH